MTKLVSFTDWLDWVVCVPRLTKQTWICDQVGCRAAVRVSLTQSCLTLCIPMDCSLPGPSIHRILRARILKWVAIFFCRRSSRPGMEPRSSCIAGDFLRKPISSVQFSCSVVSDSLWLHGLQQARLPCPSPMPRKPIWSSNPTSGHISRQNSKSKRCMHPSVHSSTVHNNQDMETI